MIERDLVGPLQAAIDRADPSWTSQPSRLRRRLEEEMGADARRHRAQIHQLVVAAEERLPLRLQRNGWSPAERTELVQQLVNTRGWTTEAADWTVTTWAAALGLTTERPPVPSPVAQTETPRSRASADDAMPARDVGPATPTELPSVVVAGATVVPDAPARAASDAAATVLPGALVPAATVLPAAQLTPPPPPPPSPLPPSPLPPPTAAGLRSTESGDASHPGATSGLRTRGMGNCTKRTAAFLGVDLDVAYDIKTGPTPALLLLALPVGLAAFVVPALSGVLLMAFLLIIIIGSLMWPRRILAVQAHRVWLLDNSGRIGIRPRTVLAQGERSDIVAMGGWPFPSVGFGGERLWFQYPITRAARQLPDSTAAEVQP